MSHTPGPWDLSWDESDGFTIRMGTARRSPVSCDIAHIVEGYAECLYPEDGEQFLEAEANAHLMAAAPDMFDVIKAYEQWEADLILSNEAWNGSLPCMTQELYDRFIEIQSMRNSAIAKAKGES